MNKDYKYLKNILNLEIINIIYFFNE